MINYKWIGSLPEKDHHMIWGIIEIDRAGFDPVADDHVYTYKMFSGRSDKRLTIKSFIDIESNIIELINRKLLKGYTVLPIQEFKVLCKDFENIIKNEL